MQANILTEKLDPGVQRSRAHTNTSHISTFMESSWEEIQTDPSPDGSTSRHPNPSLKFKSKSKRKFKLKFSNLFGQHNNAARSSELVTENTPAEQSVHDLNVSGNSVVLDKELADTSFLAPHPEDGTRKHSSFRLTMSDRESKSPRFIRAASRLRSASVSDKKAVLATESSSTIRTLFSKRSRNSIPSRSIGIVGGEDFIINPSKGDKLVSYFHTQWNNVRYGFNIRSKIHLTLKSPIWLLGHCYTLGNDENESEKNRLHDEFLSDFRSRIWFTYRREFPLLAGSSLTSDCGWGCMLRSGQMLLAQALIVHFLGRDWRWNASDTDNRGKEVFHRQLIRWCGDNQQHDQLFGLHKLVTVGQKSGKRAGDWYGPASLAFILQKAMLTARLVNPLLRQIHVYVSQDCTIFKADVADLLSDLLFGLPSTGEGALVILIPVRLGIGKVNRMYLPCLKDLLTLKYSIGIIGGRPSHSLYFVGWQDNEFITLDPHYCQETVDVTERNFQLETFHCAVPQKLSMSRLDPSCTLGFYCHNLAEFEDFCRIASEVQQMYCKGFPMFTFSDGRLSDYDSEELTLEAFDADHRNFSYSTETGTSSSARKPFEQKDNDYVVL